MHIKIGQIHYDNLQSACISSKDTEKSMQELHDKIVKKFNLTSEKVIFFNTKYSFLFDDMWHEMDISETFIDSFIDTHKECSVVVEPVLDTDISTISYDIIAIHFANYTSRVGKMHKMLEYLDQVIDVPGNPGSVHSWHVAHKNN